MDLRDYTQLVKAIGLSLILFFITRIIFVLFNLDYLNQAEASEIVMALIYGLRFDLASVFIINTPYILLSLYSFKNTFYQAFRKIIYVIFNFVFLVINIVDVEFFSFLGKKLTADIFDIQSDIQDQLPQLMVNYWYLVLICLILFAVLIKFYPRKKTSIMYVPSYPMTKVLTIAISLIVFTFIMIRGGVQMRSISPKQAYVFSKYELGNVSLNASYTLIRSFESKKVDKIKYFNSDEQAVSVLKKLHIQNQTRLNYKNQNIVFIILESFSWEYIEQGYAPNLSELMKQSLSFEESFANGRRSIEALPSILTGFPSLVGKPLSQSQFQANKFISLPRILSEHGYQTSFFHGGKKGTMDFDAYCKSIGIKEYFSKDDYPNQAHYDGNWGIFDHHYLHFFAKKLDTYKEPFFSSIFTLSSHQPYTLPDDLKLMFDEGELAIHKSIRYVDHALAEFFESIKDTPWFKNTLFVITADHTQKMISKKYTNSLGKYRVPLIFYHPNIDLTQYKQDIVTQHADILPSVLDFLGIENKDQLLFGSSVFQTKQTGWALNFQSGRYLFYKKPYLLSLDDNKEGAFEVDWSRDMSLKKIAIDGVPTQYFDQLKAFIQYSRNGLINNNIYELSH